jgi:hypothetical protein
MADIVSGGCDGFAVATCAAGGVAATACQDGGQHLSGPVRKLREWPVPVHPLTEVDLGDGVGSESGRHVDEDADVDAVAAVEDHAVKGVAPDGVFPCEWLADGRQLRGELFQQRPGQQLGDPSALAGLAVTRPAGMWL